MTPEIYGQAKRIIEQAEELPEAVRNEHIERLCAGKPELLNYIKQQRAASAGAGRAMPTRSSSQGTGEMPVRLGQFEIKALIGQGGMGQVFRAWDPNMARTVAIKTIRIGGNIDFATNRQLLLAEMKLGGKLTGINGIVTFHHADVDEETGVAYIVMEFVDGHSLQNIIEPGRPLEQSFALDILKQAAAALDLAHAKGVVHCDVKPSNILLHQGITVKITDFGISRFKEPGVTPETVPAQGLGTPEYMSPEQALGYKVLDGRSDQYSLAVVAFQLLTGRLPFAGSSILVQQAILGTNRPSASAVNTALPAAVDEPLKRGMARNDEDRFDSCAGFVNALSQAMLRRPMAQTATVASSDPYLTTATHPENLRHENLRHENLRHENLRNAEPVRVAAESKRGHPILYGVVAAVALTAFATAAIRNFPDLFPWGKRPRPVVPSVTKFIADPASVDPGGAAFLRWDVKGADAIVIDHGVGNVRASGSFEIRPEVATTYTLNASSNAGETSANTRIAIVSGKIPAPRAPDPAPKPKPNDGTGSGAVEPGKTQKPPVPLPVITRFVGEPDTVGPGETARLSWETSGADAAAIDRGIGRAEPVAGGSVQVRPSATTEYTLRATNSTGEVPARVTIKVTAIDVETLLHKGKAQLARHEYPEAFDAFLKAAQAGNTEGMVLAGTMYSEGLGRPQDRGEAVRWFQQAADAGNVRGIYNLGLMYEIGWPGHAKNDFDAANWYAKAVPRGSIEAAYRLGMMYEVGRGVPKSLPQARDLYQTAGTPEAKSRLAMLPKPSTNAEPPPPILTVNSISPSPIQENRVKQYRLSGSGFSPESEVRLDVEGFVGSRPDRANFRPVEVGPGGFWLKVYINIPPRQQSQMPVHVIVRNPDGHEVRLEARTAK